MVHQSYESRLIYLPLLGPSSSYKAQLYHLHILGGFTTSACILCSIAEYKI